MEKNAYNDGPVNKCESCHILLAGFGVVIDSLGHMEGPDA